MAANPRFLAALLVGATLLYNVAEGALSILAGLQADSLMLVAFGSDSYLEVLAAAAVLWRLSYSDEEKGEQAEGRAMRIIGMTFLLLATAIIVQGFLALLEGEGARESLLGLTLLALSLTLMPALSIAKLWLAVRTQTPVLAAEARETVACSFLSLTALIGAIAILLAGWWWIDAAAALLMVPWLVREGLEGLGGQRCVEDFVLCFCRRCFLGLRSCSAPCCAAAG